VSAVSAADRRRRPSSGRPASGGARPARPPAAHRYGQHHLVDRGTLDAILALAAVQPADVVLEVGAADGTLTRPLLAAAAHVHAYEVDRRFAGALEGLAAEQDSLTLHLVDAMRADFGRLQPVPTAFVANLAYNIAIPVIMKSLEEAPGLRRWAVMVQRELADRLFARPSTKPYSSVSVLVQLVCRPVAARPIPRTVFSPRPRVDSTFVVFERREQEPEPATYAAAARLVRAAFGQRRKMLANSLNGVSLRYPAAGGEGDRTVVPSAASVRAALEGLGLGSSARPEELTPSQLLDLTTALFADSETETGRRQT
jgi:16S rRNA (adenine1518-N6/adenine1519-N6)-dimethyltransferase